MFARCAALLFLLGLISFSGAREENSTTVDVAPSFVNITSHGLIVIGQKLYYIEDRQPLNWFDARASCDSMGADLISFETEEKWDSFNRYLDSINSKLTFWTSGNDLMKLGKHVWLPSGKPVASKLWTAGAPNNTGRKEHCDEFRYPKFPKLNDCNCQFEWYYICEYL